MQPTNIKQPTKIKDFKRFFAFFLSSDSDLKSKIKKYGNGDLRCLSTWEAAYENREDIKYARIQELKGLQFSNEDINIMFGRQVVTEDGQQPGVAEVISGAPLASVSLLSPKTPLISTQATTELLERCYIKSSFVEFAEMAIATPTSFKPPFPRPPAPATPAEPEDDKEDNLTPEQLNQKRLIEQSWGACAAENYQSFIQASKYNKLPIWHLFPDQDDWSNENRKLLSDKNQDRKQFIRKFGDYGNIKPQNGRRHKVQRKAEEKRGRGISFAYTLPQLLAGTKTVTRRKWKEKYAQSMIKNWSEKLYPALSKSYCFGGEPVGAIRFTKSPYQEKISDMPESDVSLEGFPGLSKQEFIDRFFGGDTEAIVWVVRFKFTSTNESNIG